MNQYAKSLTTRFSPCAGATNESDCRLPTHTPARCQRRNNQ